MSGIEQEHISFAYTYDDAGNITSEVREYKNTTPHTYKTTSYAYDALGQLIRVNDQNDTTSGNTGTTWTYLYDRGGNILSKSRYAYTAAGTNVGTAIETISYTYGDSGWKDKLTAYNGQTITYDNIGNPLNDGTWTYTWTAGRQLAQMSKTGMTVQFKYDHNGLRMQKIATENGVTTTTNYVLHGKLLTHMTRGTDNLHFRYDAQSRPAEVDFNGTKFSYVHNLQGDIVGLLDAAGALVVEYRYDAWGKPLGTTGTLAATLGARNPFRYRGYIYDGETELCYLQKRYINPAILRFMCIDDLLNSNLYSYCKNNPIMYEDPEGMAEEPSTVEESDYDKRTKRFLIYLAGETYLVAKNYMATLALWNKFMRPWSDSTNYDNAEYVRETLADSDDLKSKIKEDYYKYGTFFRSSVDFESGDLHYAIHSASYYADLRCEDGYIRGTVMVYDIFDFSSEFKTDNRFAMLVNSGGVMLQKTQLGTVFYHQHVIPVRIPLE